MNAILGWGRSGGVAGIEVVPWVEPIQRTPGEGGAIAGGSAGAAEGSIEWRYLGVGDLPASAARLRAAGCPDAVARAVLAPELALGQLGLVRDLYARAGLGYWDSVASKQGRAPVDEAKAEAARRLSDLLEAQSRAVEAVFGNARESDARRGGDLERRSAEACLSESNRARVARQREARSETLSALRRAGLGEAEIRARMEVLDADHRTQLEGSMEPGELKEWDARTSKHQGVLVGLYGFGATEEERFKVLDVYGGYGDAPSEEEQRARDARLAEVLGPARAAEFFRSRDGDFQQLARVADRLGLETGVAERLYAHRVALTARGRELSAGGVGEGDGSARARLRAEARGIFLGALGAAGFDAAGLAAWVEGL